MDSDKQAGSAFLAGILVSVMLMGILLISIVGDYEESRDNIKKKAIEHGYAIHHPETGVFTWKAELGKSDD